MTTIAFSRPASTGRTHLTLTVRGRRVLAGLAALPATIVLALAVIGGGSAIAAAQDDAPAQAFETVTVMSGDSLWSIAETIAPHADPRDVVDAIARLNALDGGTVAAGQELAIPAQFSSAR